MTSCDDYLDKMPDNRTELDETSKIQDMLVSCYPTTHYAAIAEFESDNTDHMDVLGYTSFESDIVLGEQLDDRQRISQSLLLQDNAP